MLGLPSLSSTPGRGARTGCPISATGSADSIFVHDPSFLTGNGAVLLRPGKSHRRCEVEEHATLYRELDLPVLGRLVEPARAEGGDLLWLDETTLAVGLGFRTNAEGLRQIAETLRPAGVEVFAVPLPWHTGPEACLHLMSLVSMVDRDLAVGFRPLLPVAFLERLDRAGVTFVEVPEVEFETQGPNVLAVAPRDCILLEENAETARRLERAGCRVRTYRGDEISHNAEGGPTCLTRALLRE